MACSWSCLAGFVWTIDYEFEVTAERRAGDGDWQAQSSSQHGRADLLSEDDTASFAISVRPGGIDVTVRNLSPTPLGLGVAQARYVDADGGQQALYVAGAGNEGRPFTVTKIVPKRISWA